jgi:cold shock CspA family protein
LIEVAGFVESFDDRRGDGYIHGDDGEQFYFHCVQISDGSRSIPVGARVTAQRRVGRLGRDEVGHVIALS